MTIRKWRFSGVLSGTSAFLKLRHIWTRHPVRSSEMCVGGKEKAGLGVEGALTAQALDVQFPQMLLSLAVVRGTEMPKCVFYCPGSSALATVLCHSQRHDNKKNNPTSAVGARAKSYI